MWFTLVNDRKLYCPALCPQRDRNFLFKPLVCPALCMTGKGSGLGNRRSFLEVFFFFPFYFFHRISCSPNNSRSPPDYRLHRFREETCFNLKSWVVSCKNSSCKNWGKFSICCWHFQLVSAWTAWVRGFQLCVTYPERDLLSIFFLTLPTCIKALWKGEWALKLPGVIFKIFNNIFSTGRASQRHPTLGAGGTRESEHGRRAMGRTGAESTAGHQLM